MEMKEYKAPEMEVVELKNQAALLAGSEGDGSIAPDPTESGEGI